MALHGVSQLLLLKKPAMQPACPIPRTPQGNKTWRERTDARFKISCIKSIFWGGGGGFGKQTGVTQARGKSFYCNAVISEGAYGKWTIKDLMLLTLLARAKISSVDFRSLFYTQSLGPLHFLLSAHRCTSFNRMCSQNDQPQRLKLCSCNYKQMGGFICT